MEEEYTITCNEEQLRLIAKALEMHSRMRCGQLGESYMPPIREKIWKLEGEELQNRRRQVEAGLYTVKNALWPELHRHESYGVGHDHQADLGYETYKCILSQFEKEREEECKAEGKDYHGNVHTGTPLKLTKIPFIKIERHGLDKSEKEEAS